MDTELAQLYAGRPEVAWSNILRYLPGGGAFYYLGYDKTTGSFTAQDTDASILVLVSKSPVTYQRSLNDGSIEIYAQADGSTTYPRRIFLTRVIDPQGNTVSLNYDSQRTWGPSSRQVPHSLRHARPFHISAL
jgi:hypothetical protein